MTKRKIPVRLKFGGGGQLLPPTTTTTTLLYIHIQGSEAMHLTVNVKEENEIK